MGTDGSVTQGTGAGTQHAALPPRTRRPHRTATASVTLAAVGLLAVGVLRTLCVMGSIWPRTVLGWLSPDAEVVPPAVCTICRLLCSPAADAVLGLMTAATVVFSVAMLRPNCCATRRRALVGLSVSLAAMASWAGPRAVFHVSYRQQLQRAAQMVRDHPQDAGPHAIYASWLQARGDHRAAVAEAAIAEHLDRSGNPDYPVEQGRGLLALGQPAVALPALERAYALRGNYDRTSQTESLRGHALDGDQGRSIARSARWRHLYAPMIVCLVLLERYEEARRLAEEEESNAPIPDFSPGTHLLLLYRATGSEAQLEAGLKGLRRGSPAEEARDRRRLHACDTPDAAKDGLQRWARGWAAAQ
jgi:hypothetical protein